jgi:hypothetical protein
VRTASIEAVQVAQVRGVPLHFAVARNEDGIVECDQLVQGVVPFTGEAAETVGLRVHHEVAAGQDLLAGQPDDRVALRVSLAEPAHLDLTLPPHEDERVGEGQGGQHDLRAQELGTSGLDVGDERLPAEDAVGRESLALLVLAGGHALLKLLQELGHLGQEPIEADVVTRHARARRRMSDDLDARELAHEHLVAQVVIAVPVRVHDVAHGFVRDRTQEADHALRGGHRASAVHGHHVGVVHDEDHIPIHRLAEHVRTHGHVDSVRHAA